MTAPPPSGARAAELIARLGLQPHPERGYFVETYRSSAAVTAPANGARRAAGTAIYFLVTREQPTTADHATPVLMPYPDDNGS